MTKGTLMSNNLASYYKTYCPIILRRCRKFLKDEALAKETMQEVFICLLKNSNNLKNKKKFNYVFLTTTNICLRKLNRLNVKQ